MLKKITHSDKSKTIQLYEKLVAPIDGEVMSISEEAIEDENLGLFYSTRVKLSDNKMNVDGKWGNLSPAMTVAVEVETWKSRLIDISCHRS